MPNPTSKTLSPAELAKLEHAFASDPASEAYKSLAEAYLGMGRYMEAMVVCKKGVKAHPSVPDPRLLLARVYAEQGKDKKALEELSQALQIASQDKNVLRMLGGLQMKTGEVEPGKATLLKALQADPEDPETLEALQQWKVPVPAAAAPAPAAPMSGPPVLHQVATPAVQAASARAAAVQSAPTAAASASPAHLAAARAQPAPRPAPRYVDEDDEEVDGEDVPAPRARASNAAKSTAASKKVFFALLAVGSVGILGYHFITQNAQEKRQAIRNHLKVAEDQLKHDSFASYKLACEAADKALEVDSSSVAAHGNLAYAWAIRWGEHGGGDEARKRAEEHLARAREEADGAEPSSHLIAAEALIKTYAGKGQEALKELDARVKQFASEGKRSSLLALTLGLIQINAGDLERARESLEEAQSLAPADPRVYAALGTLFRRLGQDNQAWKNFDFALRYENNHPESLLGKALLMLERENAELYVDAAKQIKRLVEAEPPPSPRQLAMGHLANAFLISRVSNEVGFYKADFQKELLEGTGVPADKKKAQAEIAKAEELGFTLDRNNPELHLIKGRRLFLEGAMDDAIAEIRNAIKLDGSRAQFYVELARALMARKGGEKEAEAALETAVKTMGNSPKLVLMLGQAKQRQGKLDDALKQFQLALGDGKSRTPEARLAMGTIYREKKEYGRAQEHLEKAAQEFVGQNARVAAAYTELGRALEEKGDREKAEEIYQRALNADPDHADAYYFYARHLAQDRKSEAKARLTAREYLKRAPKGDYAQEAARIAE